MSSWRQKTTITEFSLRPQPPPHDSFRNRNPPRRNSENDQPPGRDFRQPPRDIGRQPGERMHIDIVSIFMFIVIIAISISTDVSKRLQTASEQAAKAEADKANAELSVLKAQVNPHFLFNTLNNIYSLAIMGNENTAESIMKLSNIMRYATDEAPEDFVSLQKEVDCLNDFIDLQRLRMGSKVMLDYNVTGNAAGRYIAPFILLTFAENTFKYGINNQTASRIVIELTIENSGIRFLCSNPLPETTKTDRKGTGVANVKKRLHHLYPGRHTLNISANNNLYTVQLFVNDK